MPASNDGVWLGKAGETAYLAGPTDHGLFMAAVGATIERRDELRADRAAGHAALLRGWPELHASLGDARRVGPVRMMSRWHGFFRESAGPGWVLVGGAGHFKDPTPGQGISDALRQVTASSVFTPALALGTGARALLAGQEPRWQVLRNARRVVGNEVRRALARRALPAAA